MAANVFVFTARTCGEQMKDERGSRVASGLANYKTRQCVKSTEQMPPVLRTLPTYGYFGNFPEPPLFTVRHEIFNPFAGAIIYLCRTCVCA